MSTIGVVIKVLWLDISCHTILAARWVFDRNSITLVHNLMSNIVTKGEEGIKVLVWCDIHLTSWSLFSGYQMIFYGALWMTLCGEEHQCRSPFPLESTRMISLLGFGKSDTSTFFVLAMHISTSCSVFQSLLWYMAWFINADLFSIIERSASG